MCIIRSQRKKKEDPSMSDIYLRYPHWKKDCPNKGNKDKDEPTMNIARDEDEQDSSFMVSSPENHSSE